MKCTKNKIVFGLLIANIVLFLIGYSLYLVQKEEETSPFLEQITVPELEGELDGFDSKLDAVNAIKEERERLAPSVYEEQFLDSLGYFDPDLMEKEKQRLTDSIFKDGRLDYTNYGLREDTLVTPPLLGVTQVGEIETDSMVTIPVPEQVSLQERGLEQQLFFASNPSAAVATPSLVVEVDGTQTVQKDFRLQLRLVEDATIAGQFYPKNTLVFGFVSFKPNRVLLSITNIGHTPLALVAYDFADGNEGIYVENGLKSQVIREAVGDGIEEVNLPGVPQVTGIKQLFRRNHQNTKVTLFDSYKLLLKSN